LQSAHDAPLRKSIALDDVTFHHCVDLTKFSSDRVVTFVPPDGEFELMKYRVTDDITLPFKVMPLIREIGRSRIEITVKLRACYAPSIAATSVIVRIPVPGHTARATVNVSGGKAKYKAEVSALVWKLKRLPGHDEMHLSADVELVRRAREQRARGSRLPQGKHAVGQESLEPPTHLHVLPGAYVHFQRA
jgi:AP-2 complex subunit mu-1